MNPLICETLGVMDEEVNSVEIKVEYFRKKNPWQDGLGIETDEPSELLSGHHENERSWARTGINNSFSSHEHTCGNVVSVKFL